MVKLLLKILKNLSAIYRYMPEITEVYVKTE